LGIAAYIWQISVNVPFSDRLAGLHHYLVHYNHIMALRTILHKPTKVPTFIWDLTQGHRKTNGHCFNIRCHCHHDHSVHVHQYCMIRFFMVKAICTTSLITQFQFKNLNVGDKIEALLADYNRI